MSALIKFINVSKKIHNKDLLTNINFEVKKNELTTLIGPNGAGKTTIARLILGLSKPSSGHILVDSKIKIGYVPQKLDFNKNLPITAYKFLSILAPKYDYKDHLDLINFIDLKNIQDVNINHLSGGQLQKLMLAGTLFNKPEIIILDEPTKFMDAESQQRFYQLIDQLKKKHNTTIFMISHDLFIVMKNSDQVICLNKHICCSARPNEEKPNQDFIDNLSTIKLYLHHHDHIH